MEFCDELEWEYHDVCPCDLRDRDRICEREWCVEDSLCTREDISHDSDVCEGEILAAECWDGFVFLDGSLDVGTQMGKDFVREVAKVVLGSLDELARV